MLQVQNEDKCWKEQKKLKKINKLEWKILENNTSHSYYLLPPIFKSVKYKIIYFKWGLTFYLNMVNFNTWQWKGEKLYSTKSVEFLL